MCPPIKYCNQWAGSGFYNSPYVRYLLCTTFLQLKEPHRAMLVLLCCVTSNCCIFCRSVQTLYLYRILTLSTTQLDFAPSLKLLRLLWVSRTFCY